MQKSLTDFFVTSCEMSMSSLNIGNICEFISESEHFSVSTVDEVTVCNKWLNFTSAVQFYSLGVQKWVWTKASSLLMLMTKIVKYDNDAQ